MGKNKTEPNLSCNIQPEIMILLDMLTEDYNQDRVWVIETAITSLFQWGKDGPDI